jgi:hypothetical protein
MPGQLTSGACEFLRRQPGRQRDSQKYLRPIGSVRWRVSCRNSAFHKPPCELFESDFRLVEFASRLCRCNKTSITDELSSPEFLIVSGAAARTCVRGCKSRTRAGRWNTSSLPPGAGYATRRAGWARVDGRRCFGDSHSEHGLRHGKQQRDKGQCVSLALGEERDSFDQRQTTREQRKIEGAVNIPEIRGQAVVDRCRSPIRRGPLNALRTDPIQSPPAEA